MPSQCIVQKTMQPKKGNMAGVRSIATKVVLQINCKLGGRPWMIQMPMKGCMVCGFDVSHNTVARSGESYGAFVGSNNGPSDLESFLQLSHSTHTWRRNCYHYENAHAKSSLLLHKGTWIVAGSNHHVS